MLLHTMRIKIVGIFFVLISAFIVSFAQTTPNWYDNDMRKAFYPDGQYFTGFSEGERKSNENLETATSRLKDAARVEAMSTIRVHVQNTTTNHALSQTIHTMEGTLRQSMREFTSDTKTTVDLKIPGVQIESWQNPQNGRIAAFAYVKKSTLIRQLEKIITVGITKAETSLDQIDQLIQTGQKMQARDLAKKILPQFEEINQAQELLASVDENADEESLQLQETRTLQQRLTGIIAQLKNGINIYLRCQATIFGSNYSNLSNEIKGELSKLGCNFVNTEAQSDWTIYITSEARKYNAADYGGNMQYFCYVDVKITIKKIATGQSIYENQMSEKGGHSLGYDNAARVAYQELSPKISDIIKQQIQQ